LSVSSPPPAGAMSALRVPADRMPADHQQDAHAFR
jgi:hypothetical protein